jgi:general secretion pathway protein K
VVNRILRKQQGAAMVIAMLVVALVAVFSVSMSTEYNFSVRRVSNQMVGQQAYNYLRGTEAIAHKALTVDLMMDREKGVTSDNLAEFWAQEMPPFVLDEGSYTAKLTDLQGRFNLNSLRKPSLVFSPQQPIPAVPYTIEQGVFMRLLQAVGDDTYSVSQSDAQAITEAVVDWLDEDQDPTGFNCGEDDAYYSIVGRQPHRTSNLPFFSVSELRLICNLPVELYERLRPFVTVWPISGAAVINLNTAPVPVLRSVIVSAQDVPRLQAINSMTTYLPPEPLSEYEIETLVSNQQFGYDQLTTLAADLQGNQLWPNAPVGLFSDYFLLQSVATLGDVTQIMNSVISREGGKIEFLVRSMGSI